MRKRDGTGVLATFTLQKKLAAEFVGTAGLLATVIGSGIMAESLAGGNVAIALLGNTLATGAILFVLIEVFGPVSGAHFNPAVTLAFLARGELTAALALGGNLALAAPGTLECSDGEECSVICYQGAARNVVLQRYGVRFVRVLGDGWLAIEVADEESLKDNRSGTVRMGETLTCSFLGLRPRKSGG